MQNQRLKKNKLEDLQKQIDKELKKQEKLKKKNGNQELIMMSEKKIDMILQQQNEISRLLE